MGLLSRIRPFPGYRHDCPRPSGRGRRPEAGRGGGCWHIESRDRGGGACPLPVCPSPRGDTSHGPVHGEGLKSGLARGFTLPDAPFPGYRRDCPQPETGWGRRPCKARLLPSLLCDCWRIHSHASKSLNVR